MSTDGDPGAWPSVVLVDLDNTLHDYRSAAEAVRSALTQRIEQEHGIAADVVRARYEQLIAGDQGRAFKSGQEMRLARMRALIATWPQTQDADPGALSAFVEEALLGAIRPFEGALEALRALEARGRMLVLTEGYEDTQSLIARRLGLSTSVGMFLATKTVNARKADGSAFRAACEHLGVPAAEMVMVGDNWDWDILAAARAGLRQVWVGADDERASHPPDGFLGRVATFRDVPELLAERWPARARQVVRAARMASEPASDGLAAIRQGFDLPHDIRRLVAALQAQIEAAAAAVLDGSEFDSRNGVAHTMIVGSTSRETYSGIPVDFDLVIHTRREQAGIDHADARAACHALLKRVTESEPFARYVSALGRGMRPAIELESIGTRGPQSLVARYELVLRDSTADHRALFLDVTFGKLPQLVGYEIWMQRYLASLPPEWSERLRAEIRMAKAVLGRVGDVYGSANRGLKAHAVEQLIIRSADYRATGLPVGTLDNALRLIFEEGIVEQGGIAEVRTFAQFRARYPLWHPGWWEREVGFEPGVHNVDLWDTLGNGDAGAAERKWRKLVALALAYAAGEAWSIDSLVAAATAAAERLTRDVAP